MTGLGDSSEVHTKIVLDRANLKRLVAAMRPALTDAEMPEEIRAAVMLGYKTALDTIDQIADKMPEEDA